VFLHHTLPNSRSLQPVHLPSFVLQAADAVVMACGFGLSLFFVLSAFLICELLLREREATGSVSVKQFYVRRILRIWPLYYFALILGVVMDLLPGGRPAEILGIGWFAVFLGAWQVALTLSYPVLNPVTTVLWTVSVEEQFYLIAPWLTKYLSRRNLIVFCLILIAIANCWLFYFGAASVTDLRIWHDTFVQSECFAAGILLCLVLRGRLPNSAIWQRTLTLIGAGACWILASPVRFLWGPNPGGWHLMGGYALAALGAVLTLIGFLGVSPKFLPAFVTNLGRISYGLYVYHLFVIYAVHNLLIGRHIAAGIPSHVARNLVADCIDYSLSVFGTFLLAALSYRYLETPFLRMKKRHTVIEAQPIGFGRA
jgi:peptidoglycan/LPS O-acetylase OafA/YrhL